LCVFQFSQASDACERAHTKLYRCRWKLLEAVHTCIMHARAHTHTHAHTHTQTDPPTHIHTGIRIALLHVSSLQGTCPLNLTESNRIALARPSSFTEIVATASTFSGSSPPSARPSLASSRLRASLTPSPADTLPCFPLASTVGTSGKAALSAAPPRLGTRRISSLPAQTSRKGGTPLEAWHSPPRRGIRVGNTRGQRRGTGDGRTWHRRSWLMGKPST